MSGSCAHPPDGDILYVKDVLQKAMISMQEKGGRSCCSYGRIAGAGAAFVPEPTPVHNPTGAVLMLGHIQDPTDAGSP